MLVMHGLILNHPSPAWFTCECPTKCSIKRYFVSFVHVHVSSSINNHKCSRARTDLLKIPIVLQNKIVNLKTTYVTSNFPQRDRDNQHADTFRGWRNIYPRFFPEKGSIVCVKLQRRLPFLRRQRWNCTSGHPCKDTLGVASQAQALQCCAVALQ